jgi:hypothetical protein
MKLTTARALTPTLERFLAGVPMLKKAVASPTGFDRCCTVSRSRICIGGSELGSHGTDTGHCRCMWASRSGANRAAVDKLDAIPIRNPDATRLRPYVRTDPNGFVDALKARVVQASGRLEPLVVEALKERVESIL